MTPQQRTAKTIVDVIKGHPDGVAIDTLLREVLKQSQIHNTPFYLGSDCSFASFLHDLEHRKLLKLTRGQDAIIVQAMPELDDAMIAV